MDWQAEHAVFPIAAAETVVVALTGNFLAYGILAMLWVIIVLARYHVRSMMSLAKAHLPADSGTAA